MKTTKSRFGVLRALTGLLLATFFPARVDAQVLYQAKPVEMRATDIPVRSSIPRKAPAASRAGQPTDIQVTYTGFTADQQIAFEYAVDIWESQLVNPQPITIQASMLPLGAGVLGSCAPYLSTGPATPVAGALYPTAFVNQFSDCDLFPSTPDMVVVLNSTANWYTDVDAAPGLTQYDMITVVLHEIAHGLGFVSSANYDNGVAPAECAGAAGTGCFNVPILVFDAFVEDVTGNELSNPTFYTQYSGALGAALTNNNLYWSGAQAFAANGGVRPRLYAPATFALGSSIAHLDETLYPAGDPRSLITPALNLAEANHDPGNVLVAMLQDMGWTPATVPVARFDVRDTWYAGLPLPFSDFSALATTWEWDFQNNGVADAFVQNPSFTYAAAGNYTTRLVINGNNAYAYNKSIEVYPLPAIPYEIDFETNSGGFYASKTTCDQWERGVPSTTLLAFYGAIQGPNAWVTNLGSNHGTNTSYYLETPPFYLIGAVGDYFLSFRYRWAAAADAGFNVLYSINGGTTWAVLGGLQGVDPDADVNWYNQASIAALGGQPGWQQPFSSATVFQPSYRINNLTGNADVRFRIQFGAAAGNGEGVMVDLFRISGNVLPAETLNLRGKQAGEAVVLDWNAFNDPLTSLFEVEWSETGADFSAVGRVDVGQGNTSYDFTHMNPSEGINYYRLKREGVMGDVSYSPATEVMVSKEGWASVWPNPSAGQLALRWKGRLEHFRLYAADGREVLGFVPAQTQAETAEMNLGHLPSGIYLYELRGEGKVQRGKWIKN